MRPRFVVLVTGADGAQNVVGTFLDLNAADAAALRIEAEAEAEAAVKPIHETRRYLKDLR